MKHRFTIHYRLPSLNEYLNKCKFNKHMAAQFKMIHDRRIYDEVKSQLHDLKITKPIKLHITWIEENRKRDVDNVYSAVKYILDGLVKAEVLQNDNAKRVKDISNEIIYADTSEVIVEIEELEDDLYEIKRLHRVL